MVHHEFAGQPEYDIAWRRQEASRTCENLRLVVDDP